MKLEFWHPVSHEIKYVPVEYTPRKKSRWFRLWFGLAMWLIRKVGKITLSKNVVPKYEMQTIDMDKVGDLIHKSSMAVRQYHERKCKYVVLGRKQMMEAITSACDDHSFQCIHLDKAYKGRVNTDLIEKWYGMDIVFVPWIDDAVIPLPEFDVALPPTRRSI
jgi:hypothetical protein